MPAAKTRPGSTKIEADRGHRLLLRRHRHAAVRRLRRPDGNQVLLLRQPADGVREQVQVAQRAAAVGVAGEIGVAKDDDARFGLRRLAGRRRARRRRRLRPAPTPRRRAPPARACRRSPRPSTRPRRRSATRGSTRPSCRAWFRRCAVATRPLVPPSIGIDAARERIDGERAKRLGDRVLRIGGRHGDARIVGRAADVDDDVVARRDAPFLEDALRGSAAARRWRRSADRAAPSACPPWRDTAAAPRPRSAGCRWSDRQSARRSRRPARPSSGRARAARPCSCPSAASRSPRCSRRARSCSARFRRVPGGSRPCAPSSTSP